MTVIPGLALRAAPLAVTLRALSPKSTSPHFALASPRPPPQIPCQQMIEQCQHISLAEVTEMTPTLFPASQRWPSLLHPSFA